MATVVGSKPLNGRTVGKTDASGGTTKKSFAGFLSAVSHRDDVTIEKVYGSGYRSWQSVNKASLGESSGQVGGYLVPTDYSDAMLDRMLDFAVIRPRAMVVPMAGVDDFCPKVDIETATGTAGVTSLFGGVNFTWGQSQTPGETEPAFRQNVLTSWDLLGYAKVSNQWLADVGVRGDRHLTNVFAGASNWQCEYAYLNGGGAAGTMPLGVLNAPATIQVVRTTHNKVTQADVANMAASLLPYSWINAIWLCSCTALAQVMQITGFIPNAQRQQADASDACVGYLLNRPLYVTDKLPALGTTGDLVLMDPSLYAIGERREVLVEKSSMGQGFPTNQTYFRVWLRGDGKPMVQASVTLQDNSTVVSPYVVLEYHS